MPDIPSKRYFLQQSERLGFKANSLEKVYRLLTVLKRIDENHTEANQIALKGGTAIQGMVFNFRRLSVDIDFNFIGSLERDKTQEIREDIRLFIDRLGEELGYTSDLRKRYALDQYEWRYNNVYGERSTSRSKSTIWRDIQLSESERGR